MKKLLLCCALLLCACAPKVSFPTMEDVFKVVSLRDYDGVCKYVEDYEDGIEVSCLKAEDVDVSFYPDEVKDKMKKSSESFDHMFEVLSKAEYKLKEDYTLADIKTDELFLHLKYNESDKEVIVQFYKNGLALIKMEEENAVYEFDSKYYEEIDDYFDEMID